MQTSTIDCNQATEGETIEQKVERMTQNKEPIGDKEGQLIYTDRKDGVNPDHDIRTDRFEYAIDAMDIASKSNKAKRDKYIKERDTKEEIETPKTNEKSGENGAQGAA